MVTASQYKPDDVHFLSAQENDALKVTTRPVDDNAANPTRP
jgi:hypothetical protein